MKILTDTMRKMKAEGRIDAKTVGGSVTCCLLINNNRGSTQNWRI